MLGLAICGWLSLTTKHGAAIRGEFLVLGAFFVGAVATVVGMIAMIGPKALTFQRYYFPVVDGVLYVFLIRSAVHVLQRGPVRTLGVWVFAYYRHDGRAVYSYPDVGGEPVRTAPSWPEKSVASC